VLTLLRKVAVDVSPLKESRDFRLIAIGGLVSGLGTQAALVALPFQIYVLSHSAALVGLLGAFELGPMIVVSLLAGAIADRTDRRRLLAAAQIAVIVAAGALAFAALAGHPPVALILILGGLLAGGAALDGVSRAAIVPNTLAPERLSTGLAFSFGLYQVTGIVGPAVGGLLIAASGVAAGYLVNALSCLAMLVAAIAIAPQHPKLEQAPPSIRDAIAEGLRFVKSNNALAGSFAIDLVAMTFGMPRALFAVLALTVYHAGAGGTGLLYSAVALGGTLAVLSSGWVGHARWLGRIVIVSVFCWGAAIAAAGLVRSIAPAIALLAVAGFADGVSAICRTTINQSVTPDALRGRMSAVFSLVVTSGPRFGDLESGFVAGATSALTSVVTGGLACIAGAVLIVLAFPELAAYDEHETRAAAATTAPVIVASGTADPAGYADSYP
jgi:Na+/melibiose symporter-like transporter